MDVGEGNKISIKWLPLGNLTGIKDINGVELKTRDKVKLRGCRSKYAYIGYNTDGKTLMLLFGIDDTTVGWHLSQEVVTRNHIELEGRGI